VPRAIVGDALLVWLIVEPAVTIMTGLRPANCALHLLLLHSRLLLPRKRQAGDAALTGFGEPVFGKPTVHDPRAYGAQV
jgi:hypothetical protein